jgi:hypothetical protein
MLHVIVVFSTVLKPGHKLRKHHILILVTEPELVEPVLRQLDLMSLGPILWIVVLEPRFVDFGIV